MRNASPNTLVAYLSKQSGGLNLETLAQTSVSRPIGTKALFLPLAFTLGLAAFAFLAPVRQNPKAAYGRFWAPRPRCCVWNAVLLVWSRRRGRTLTIEVVLKKQHYLQACVQGSLLAYWGWYWPPVYAFAPFILAQLVFAYAFDMLLVWSRRDTYTLGFAPFPVVFSINLFLWFKPDWFYLQFAIGGARVGRERADSLE